MVGSENAQPSLCHGLDWWWWACRELQDVARGGDDEAAENMLAQTLPAIRQHASRALVPIATAQRPFGSLIAQTRGKEGPGSFTADDIDRQLRPVNPFGLSPAASKAADYTLTTLDAIVNWTRTSSIWPL